MNNGIEKFKINLYYMNENIFFVTDLDSAL